PAPQDRAQIRDDAVLVYDCQVQTPSRSQRHDVHSVPCPATQRPARESKEGPRPPRRCGGEWMGAALRTSACTGGGATSSYYWNRCACYTEGVDGVSVIGRRCT